MICRRFQVYNNNTAVTTPDQRTTRADVHSIRESRGLFFLIRPYNLEVNVYCKLCLKHDFFLFEIQIVAC